MNSMGNFQVMRGHVLYSQEAKTSDTKSTGESPVVQVALQQMQAKHETMCMPLEHVDHTSGSPWLSFKATDDDFIKFDDALGENGKFRSLLDKSLETQKAKFDEAQKSGTKAKIALRSDLIEPLQDVLKGIHPTISDEEGHKIDFLTLMEGLYTNGVGDVKDPQECHAIALYTSELYNLCNYVVSNNNKGLKDFLKTWDIHPSPQELESLKTELVTIVKVLASGINKAPEFQGELYRGAKISNKEFEMLQKKPYIMDSNFISCSDDQEVAKKFASKDLNNPSTVGVIYKIEAKTARDISDYSIDDEGEKIYCPGQCFKVASVEEGKGDLEGLYIVNLHEIDLKQEGV